MTSFILPTFNEVRNIGAVIDEIAVVCDRNKVPYEIVVVDDQSSDGTAEEVLRHSAINHKVRLIIRSEEKNLARSIRHGISEAKGDYVLWMDADQSMSAQMFPCMLKKIQEGYDLVLGSRYLPQGRIKGYNPDLPGIPSINMIRNLLQSKDSLFAVVISKVGNKILHHFFCKQITDFTSGYFLCDKKIFETLNLAGDSLEYSVRFSFEACSKGFKVAEVPMICGTRKFGKSKIAASWRDLSLNIFRVVKTVYRLRTETPDGLAN